MKLTFSIVTPVLNGEKTIARTIESVLNQTNSPDEYFIVDGSSTDNTVLIAEEYAPKFAEKGIKYEIISEDDNGIYDAMNKGICKCRGDFVGIINSDDWYEPEAIEVMKTRYEVEPFDMAYADIKIHNGNKSFIKRASNPWYVSSRTWNHPTQFTCKEIYKNKLYSNESVYDDLDMLLWIHKHNYKISTINQVLANFSFGGQSNNTRGIRNMLEHIDAKIHIYIKNGYSPFYVFDVLMVEIAKFLFSKA